MTQLEPQAYVRHPSTQDSVWYRGQLMTVYAGAADTGGDFTFFEGTCPEGMGPPPHVHAREHEGLYVLEGEIEAFCGQDSFSVPAGSFVFLPRGIVHWFRPTSGTARLLAVASPGGSEGFFRELGEAPDAMRLPAPPQGPPDTGQLQAAAVRYDLTFPRPPAAT